MKTFQPNSLIHNEQETKIGSNPRRRVKSEALSADGYQNFAGPTQLCQIIRKEIRRNPGQGEDTYQRGKVWYARLTAGDLMLPVQMEFETAFGTVRGYLAELRGHGVHLHLMRE